MNIYHMMDLKNKEYEVSMSAFADERNNLKLVLYKNISKCVIGKNYNINICKFLNKCLNKCTKESYESNNDSYYDNVCNFKSNISNSNNLINNVNSNNNMNNRYNNTNNSFFLTSNKKNTHSQINDEALLKSKIQKCRLSRTFYNFILYIQENRRNISVPHVSNA